MYRHQTSKWATAKLICQVMILQVAVVLTVCGSDGNQQRLSPHTEGLSLPVSFSMPGNWGRRFRAVREQTCGCFCLGSVQSKSDKHRAKGRCLLPWYSSTGNPSRSFVLQKLTTQEVLWRVCSLATGFKHLHHLHRLLVYRCTSAHLPCGQVLAGVSQSSLVAYNLAYCLQSSLEYTLYALQSATFMMQSINTLTYSLCSCCPSLLSRRCTHFSTIASCLTASCDRACQTRPAHHHPDSGCVPLMQQGESGDLIQALRKNADLSENAAALTGELRRARDIVFTLQKACSSDHQCRQSLCQQVQEVDLSAGTALLGPALLAAFITFQLGCIESSWSPYILRRV